ncbi:MAG: hypothetical protein Q9216_005560 [Gyalolechia sp. 2 TL-2023]
MAQVPKTPTKSAAGRAKRQRPNVSSTKLPDLSTLTCTDLIQDVGEFEDSGIQMETSQPATSTPGPSSAKDRPQTSNTRNQRTALEEHMMYLDEPTSQENNTDFLQTVRAILKGDRSSEKSERSIKAIQTAQHTNRVAIENTYVSAVLPKMIGDSRTVKVKHSPTTQDLSIDVDAAAAGSSKPDVIPKMKTVVRSFAEDRLHWEGQCHFVKELITGPSTVKIFGIADPRPIRCFGIRKRGLVFNPPKVSNDTENHIHAAGALDFCFFLIEDKGPDGPYAHAVTQAIRGGATLVRVMRELRRKAGYEPSGIGADKETFVFTCAWEHGFAEIYVSWQEVRPEGEITHMTWLESYALRKDQDIKEFCRDLHNILDWGIDPQRISKLEQMVADIAKREAAGYF